MNQSSYRPYSAAEVAAIRERYSVDGPAVLGAELGRGIRNIRAKAWTLGLTRHGRKANHKARVWTEAEDDRLRKEWPGIVARKVKGRTAVWLASQMRLSVNQLRQRATDLRLRRMRYKEPPWSDDEIELLHEASHLAPKNVRRLFLKHGFKRTETALAVMRKRQEIRISECEGAYSAHGLSKLMGVSARAVCGWIEKGQLKAKPRTDAVDYRGSGPGDRWSIKPKHVREFIREYRSCVNISRVDQHWFLDLIFGDESVVKIQHSSGVKGDGCGLVEHGVMA